ncbi:N-acetyl-alpha-D-glucosaminyl L-malate synthase BshA [Salisediminibacterium halotolerans]|uniref:N-acetyl-alpha-D-glucosaminyl L-malate synthase BshA n=1 Tax=Salisediminibacterium halotolerans TaxID=517425 RepID=A0A1H9P1Z7_9BACI|nr:N-acetyl-alpha-D-glucosaminyl L-malate synthase BshA [Salisediminibacterium haloalkalitolerans]SER41603.1 N-acetyl-alpha-D-glucosaminyl L-malate synthase BshA [Salisediminibacterium haloalkalitolerans]
MSLKIGITCYPTVGGSGVVAAELGKALAEKGHDIHFISSALPYRLDDFTANIAFHQVEVNQYSVFQYPPYDLALANKMAEVIKREKLDILHVHYAVPHAISAFLAKEMVAHDVKIVTTLHGTDITVLGYDPSLSDMVRFGIQKSDCVTAVSDDLVRQTKTLLNIDDHIATVYNFIDHAVYHPKKSAKIRADLRISESAKILVHVSNFRKVKRVEDVVKVFHRIRRTNDVVLLLIGEGPEMPVIEKLVNDLGVTDHVRFLGNQKQVAELLSISDVKLLLSEKESFGLVLLEAMACGVPAVGSNIGGIPEVIEDGVSGYVRPLGDIDAIAAAVDGLLKDDALRNRMAEAAKKRVFNYFHQDRIVSDYEAVYRKALNGQ